MSSVGSGHNSPYQIDYNATTKRATISQKGNESNKSKEVSTYHGVFQLVRRILGKVSGVDVRVGDQTKTIYVKMRDFPKLQQSNPPHLNQRAIQASVSAVKQNMHEKETDPTAHSSTVWTHAQWTKALNTSLARAGNPDLTKDDLDKMVKKGTELLNQPMFNEINNEDLKNILEATLAICNHRLTEIGS